MSDKSDNTSFGAIEIENWRIYVDLKFISILLLGITIYNLCFNTWIGYDYMGEDVSSHYVTMPSLLVKDGFMNYGGHPGLMGQLNFLLPLLLLHETVEKVAEI